MSTQQPWFSLLLLLLSDRYFLQVFSFQGLIRSCFCERAKQKVLRVGGAGEKGCEIILGH